MSIAPVDRRAVAAAAVAAMRRAGFAKRGGGDVFTVRLGDDVLGWASHMTRRASDGALEISPKVGVRHEALHRLVDRLSEREPKPARSVPTISTVLGYLMPENSANVVWRFDAGTALDPQADDLAGAIVEYGRPYMDQHWSLERIAEALPGSLYAQMRVPAALLLLGRKEQAAACIEAELNKLAGRTDPRDEAAADFRRFAERFVVELTA